LHFIEVQGSFASRCKTIHHGSAFQVLFTGSHFLPLLKKGIDVLLPCITSIINRSLEVGEFPATFKNGLVTPLLKKSDLDHEILKNYRPISNLPFLGKMIERVVAMQFKQHLAINLTCIQKLSQLTVHIIAPKQSCCEFPTTST